MGSDEKLISTLEEVQKSLKYLLVIELHKLGVKQSDIAKKLKLSTKTVNDLLKIIPKFER